MLKFFSQMNLYGIPLGLIHKTIAKATLVKRADFRAVRLVLQLSIQHIIRETRTVLILPLAVCESSETVI